MLTIMKKNGVIGQIAVVVQKSYRAETTMLIEQLCVPLYVSLFVKF